MIHRKTIRRRQIKKILPTVRDLKIAPHPILDCLPSVIVSKGEKEALKTLVQPDESTHTMRRYDEFKQFFSVTANYETSEGVMSEFLGDCFGTDINNTEFLHVMMSLCGITDLRTSSSTNSIDDLININNFLDTDTPSATFNSWKQCIRGTRILFEYINDLQHLTSSEKELEGVSKFNPDLNGGIGIIERLATAHREKSKSHKTNPDLQALLDKIKLNTPVDNPKKNKILRHLYFCGSMILEDIYHLIFDTKAKRAHALASVSAEIATAYVHSNPFSHVLRNKMRAGDALASAANPPEYASAVFGADTYFYTLALRSIRVPNAKQPEQKVPQYKPTSTPEVSYKPFVAEIDGFVKEILDAPTRLRIQTIAHSISDSNIPQQQVHEVVKSLSESEIPVYLKPAIRVMKRTQNGKPSVQVPVNYVMSTFVRSLVGMLVKGQEPTVEGMTMMYQKSAREVGCHYDTSNFVNCTR